MFKHLERINSRPKPFEYYTAEDLWTDEHTSRQMLSFHLDGAVDISSRNAAFIDRSVEWIASRFEVGPGTRVVDFGCGPGLYAARLAGLGADVTGIDFSRRSIAYARKEAARKGLAVRYVNGNYLEFETSERFDLALMIMCDFCALGPGQRKKLLSTFRAILAPGGSILLDVYSLNAFAEREEAAVYEKNLMNGFWSPNRYHGFLNTFRYEDEKVVLDKYTIVEEGRTRTIFNWLQYFSPDALARELAGSGLAVKELLADVAGSPFDPGGLEFAIVAGKAG